VTTSKNFVNLMATHARAHGGGMPMGGMPMRGMPMGAGR
jgi:hypothetical protein